MLLPLILYRYLPETRLIKMKIPIQWTYYNFRANKAFEKNETFSY